MPPQAPFDWPQSTPDHQVAILRDVPIPLRDGLRLAADVYRPARDAAPIDTPCPVILIRTPYNKNGTLALNSPEFWARRGYVQVVQDVRGRFNSEGDFYLLKHEAEDGFDTIEWIARQPWCDGNVGMMGTSYLAWVQSAAATQNPPHLKAMWVNQGAFNGLTSSLRHGGALELRWLSWAFWGGSVSKEALADPTIADALAAATERFGDWLLRLPWREGATPLALIPRYERWALDLCRHGLATDDLWRSPSLNFEAHADAHADVPTMYAGGWYDSYTRATTEAFAHFAAHKSAPQHLLMGPWTHGDAPLSVTYAGDADFGPGAPVDGNLAPSVPHLQLRFFDRYLKGIDNGLDDEPRARLFVMGGGSGKRLGTGKLDHGGRWRTAGCWPPTDTPPTPFYLHADGALRTDLPPVDAAPSRYDSDPADPVPTISANISSLNDFVPQPDGIINPIAPAARRRNLVAQGGSDQRTHPGIFGARPPYLPLAARPDVCVFQSAPLDAPLEVIGPITVHLWVSTSAPDTDFTAKLIDVHPPSPDYPQGYALNLSDSIKRLRFREGYDAERFAQPDDVLPLSIELYPTANLFAAGHRIRLDISSSNFPRFDVNPNTGEPLGRHTHVAVAHNVVYHDEDHPSRIDLPIAPA